MHKEELISLHQMMVEIKDFFEKINPELKFSQVLRPQDRPLPDPPLEDGAQVRDLHPRD